jgi:hypothetical protein
LPGGLPPPLSRRPRLSSLLSICWVVASRHIFWLLGLPFPSHHASASRCAPLVWLVVASCCMAPGLLCRRHLVLAGWHPATLCGVVGGRLVCHCLILAGQHPATCSGVSRMGRLRCRCLVLAGRHPATLCGIVGGRLVRRGLVRRQACSLWPRLRQACSSWPRSKGSSLLHDILFCRF